MLTLLSIVAIQVHGHYFSITLNPSSRWHVLCGRADGVHSNQGQECFDRISKEFFTIRKKARKRFFIIKSLSTIFSFDFLLSKPLFYSLFKSMDYQRFLRPNRKRSYRHYFSNEQQQQTSEDVPRRALSALPTPDSLPPPSTSDDRKIVDSVVAFNINTDQTRTLPRKKRILADTTAIQRVPISGSSMLLESIHVCVQIDFQTTEMTAAAQRHRSSSWSIGGGGGAGGAGGEAKRRNPKQNAQSQESFLTDSAALEGLLAKEKELYSAKRKSAIITPERYAKLVESILIPVQNEISAL